MAELKFYSLKIPIDPKSELHDRISKSAEERGISFETALDEAVQVGIWGHIARNLDYIEHLYKAVKV